MPDTWAYKLGNEKLIEAFWETTIRAGVSNSGLAIDLSGIDHITSARYLYGVVLSRMEKKEPPFRPGDTVRMKPKETYYCGSTNRSKHHTAGEAKPDTEYKVRNVFYEEVYRGYMDGGKHYNWTISFKNKDGKQEQYRFPAERFEKIEVPEPVAS